jgi:hypothetical protein
MAPIVVKLAKPYEVHDTKFSTVELREPTYKEIYRDGLGRPQEWQPTPNGPMQVTYPVVVDAYLQKILISPGYECLGALSAVDSLKLERAVCDFFLDTTAS